MAKEQGIPRWILQKIPLTAFFMAKIQPGATRSMPVRPVLLAALFPSHLPNRIWAHHLEAEAPYHQTGVPWAVRLVWALPNSSEGLVWVFQRQARLKHQAQRLSPNLPLRRLISPPVSAGITAQVAGGGINKVNSAAAPEALGGSRITMDAAAAANQATGLWLLP